MDYTEIYNIARSTALSQGVSPEQYDRNETLYYDETDNVKHLIIKNGSLNSSENTCFVLGGIQAENPISNDDLHSELEKAPSKELKSTKDLRGSFTDILRKENMTKIMIFILEQGWHVHFMMVQVWYYAFVDIIDSIYEGNPIIRINLKAILYKILKSNPEQTISFLSKYKYPNINNNEADSFLGELSEICRKFAQRCGDNIRDYRLSLNLYHLINTVKGNKKELSFINNETPNEWVSSFVQFYFSEIYSYPTKKLILDTEKQVEKSIGEMSIEVNGKILKNFQFADSADSPMIQVCDYVVAILRKYFIFLDRTLCDIEKDIDKFDGQQIENYKMLKKILKQSFDYSTLFFHYISSIETQHNFMTLMNKYGN